MKNIIKQTNHRPYGECSLCNWVGSIQYHHIIPKRFKVRKDCKAQLIYTDLKTGQLKYTKHKARIQHIMIAVCDVCHRKIHPENWMYLKNKLLVEEYKKKHYQ